MEHLTWAHHQIRPSRTRRRTTRQTPVNSTEVYIARNAKVQARVEKEEAEEAMKAAEDDDAASAAADAEGKPPVA